MRAVFVAEGRERAIVGMSSERFLHAANVATSVPHRIVFRANADNMALNVFDLDAFRFLQRMAPL